MDTRAHPLASFHPLIRAWFTETLGEPSAPQRAGWPAIASGDDTLILAPTGTGKTLSAFLFELAGAQFALPDAVEMLRAPPSPSGAPEETVVMATSDPANVYALSLPGVESDPIARPRGSGALLVTVGGNVVLSTEGRGRRHNDSLRSRTRRDTRCHLCLRQSRDLDSRSRPPPGYCRRNH